MILPFLIFWVLMFLGKSELGLKGVLISIAIWTGLLLGFGMLNISPYLFVAAQSLLDIVLILVIFGGDIRIR
jgi:hypothetical protein